ncbi:MAG: hypothetical protein IJT43_08510 [Stomatobaculum sp.]|nr:hypothetical protein [Stomatobaculum sp.]
MNERTRNSRLNKQNRQSSDKKGRMSLRLVSVLIGLLIWLTVVNISNPEVSRTKTIPVTVINENVLTSAGKCYTIQGGDNVTVSYQVRSRDAYRIEADTFRVVADLSNLYNVTGSVPVTVEVVKNRELLIGTPAVRPQVIHVSTEDLQNKSFSVSSSVRGQVMPGHSVGTISVSPETIMVSGPMSQVGRISSVGIVVDISGHEEDYKGTEKPRFFDANGNVISFGDEGPVTEPEEISYEVDMLLGKTLTLQYEVSGNAAPGYRFTGAESPMKSVAVVGEDDILSKMNEVTIPGTALNVEGATENQTVTVDLSQYLPAGVTVRGNSLAAVTLKVEALNSRAFQLSLDNGIETIGRKEGLVYTLYPNLISVELSALPEELRTLSSEDLNATLDLTGLEAGNYTGHLSVTSPQGTSVASITPFTVIVSIEEEGPSGTFVGENGPENVQDPGGSETEASTEKETEASAAGQEGSESSAGAQEETQSGDVPEQTASASGINGT